MHVRLALALLVLAALAAVAPAQEIRKYENRLTPIPDSLDLAFAPLLGCAVMTGMGVLANDARLRVGESVLVFGAGGVGLNVIQGAALGGANPIVAVDLFEDKLALALKLGATHAINTRKSDVRSRWMNLPSRARLLRINLLPTRDRKLHP